MSTSYFGDNLIPGVSVKNINSAIINPMLNLGNQMGYEELFLSGQLPGQKQLKKPSADLRGSITPGSSKPAATNLGEGAAMDAAERFREGAGFPAGVTRPSDYPVAATAIKPTIKDTKPTAPTYNAKERVKKYGVKKAEDMAMMEWAKAHKKLAEKVKPGQAGYDAIQLALGKTTVEPEDIRGFMADSGKSAKEARAILGGGSVETVIDGNKPMVTTINPAVAAGGSEVEIPTADFSGMSQAMQDLVGPSLEAGAAFNINVDNVLNQNDPQAFLMEQLKKIQGIKR